MFSRIRRSIRGYRISFHNSSDSPSREEETMGGKLSTLMADAYISRAQVCWPLCPRLSAVYSTAFCTQRLANNPW